MRTAIAPTLLIRWSNSWKAATAVVLIFALRTAAHSLKFFLFVPQRLPFHKVCPYLLQIVKRMEKKLCVGFTLIRQLCQTIEGHLPALKRSFAGWCSKVYSKREDMPKITHLNHQTLQIWVGQDVLIWHT